MFPGIDAFHSYDLVDLFRKLAEAIQAFGNGGLAAWLNKLFGLSLDNYSALFLQIQAMALFISAVLLIGIIYYGLKIYKMHEQDEAFAYATPPVVDKKLAGTEIVNKMKDRWDKIVQHVESENPGDWRVAIMEADIMLDDMLDKQGYHGESIGDKLKQVEKSDFNTIDEAWEAHKVRNQIAHEGSDFLLTQRRAKEIIAMYERVFREFYMI